jgi:tripartite-type tricarboxylate transporter receptor subunit TctC
MRGLGIAALAGLGCAAFAPAGEAQDWPNGDIRYILHVEPGGATDVMARRLADGLQSELGVNVVVENRAGGSGARQLAQLTMAQPDGQTIGSVTASHLGMFQQSGEFDIDSIEWSCGLVLDPYLLAVQADSDIESLDDLVARAEENPGSLSVAGFGEGSGGQIAWMMFEEAAGLDDGEINWVPYDSVGDAVVAALGGHNDVAIAYIGLVRQHVEAGNMRVIGIMSDDRAEAIPDVPTYGEQGYEVNTSWQQFRGVIVPPETPAEYQQALCDAVESVMETEEMRRYIADSELVPGYMGPDEFRAFVEQQNELTISWMERF